MKVKKKLAIRPETVETIFDYCQEGKLLANRRYQRKLVWTIEEKETFIDSLSLNIPVPLILASEIMNLHFVKEPNFYQRIQIEI